MSTIEEELISMHLSYSFFQDMASQVFSKISLRLKHRAFDCVWCLDAISRTPNRYLENPQDGIDTCVNLLVALQDKRLTRVSLDVRDIACRINEHFPRIMRPEFVYWKNSPRPETLYAYQGS
jgi:hypothetical protein